MINPLLVPFIYFAAGGWLFLIYPFYFCQPPPFILFTPPLPSPLWGGCWEQGSKGAKEQRSKESERQRSKGAKEQGSKGAKEIYFILVYYFLGSLFASALGETPFSPSLAYTCSRCSSAALDTPKLASLTRRLGFLACSRLLLGVFR
jgi:hypothetical protein